jgi:hypothetical protein
LVAGIEYDALVDVITTILEKPPAAGADDTHAVPLEVSTLFVVPGDVNPVPPEATGSVPVTFDARFTNVVDVEPVPPLATGSVPVTFDARFTNVVDVEPVPPEATGNAFVNVTT